MNTAWRIERWRLVAMLAAVLIIGLLSGQWGIAVIVPTALYIAWQLRQAYQLEKWLHRGYKPGKVPDSSGIWESIISEILRIRKQDRKYKKRLAAAAKGYRNTIKALPDAAVVVNQALEIEWANQFAEQLFGIRLERDSGQRVSNLIRAPEFIDYLNQPGSKGLEIEAPGQAGTMLSIRVAHYGKKQRLILGRDISEPLQARNALKAFISNASHELRTPLTVTSGYIDLLRSDPDLAEHSQAPLAQLRDQTDHMIELINDLLILSQLEVRPLRADEGQCIEMGRLLSQTARNLQDAGISSNHHISLELDDALGLRGIEKEIMSISHNLLENACKYTPSGSKIRLSWARNSEGGAWLEVSDNGPGFAASLIPEITQRFYRIQNTSTSDTEGTGLGLAIVKHAVMRHSGKLEITAQPGQGARFIAQFPAFRICDI